MVAGFTFDNVYDQRSEQHEVYDLTARSLVESALNGLDFLCLFLFSFHLHFTLVTMLQYLLMGKQEQGRRSQWRGLLTLTTQKAGGLSLDPLSKSLTTSIKMLHQELDFLSGSPILFIFDEWDYGI